MPTVEQRLAALGIILPQPVAPVANYVPFVRVGNLVHISGQISIDADGGIKGTVGDGGAEKPALEAHASSTTASISTAKPRGRR